MLEMLGIGILNIVILIGLAPLVDGILRKLRARLQSRQGPPITQPYMDLLKLLGKEELTPEGVVSFNALIWRLTPALCLGATMTAALFVPLFAMAPMQNYGDVIVFLYLLGLAEVAVVLGGFASGNPYAYIGSSREVMMILTTEPVMAIALVTIAVKAHSLSFGGIIEAQAWGLSVSGAIAAIAFLLAMQAQIGKIPFDIAEAETEIMDGAFIERSGAGLALFKLAFQAKVLIFVVLMVKVFLPWPVGSVFSGLFDIVKILVVLGLVEVINVANPRLRIEQSMVYFSRIVVFVAIVALVFAALGR